MSDPKRLGLLLGLAGALVLMRFIYLPLLDHQATQLARNASLTTQLRKGEARIAAREALLGRRDRALRRLREALPETLGPDAEALLRQQKALERVIKDAGLELASFEWAGELGGERGVVHKQALLSVQGSSAALVKGALALADRRPLTQVVGLQFRNAGRGGDVLTGTLRTEMLITPERFAGEGNP